MNKVWLARRFPLANLVVMVAPPLAREHGPHAWQWLLAGLASAVLLLLAMPRFSIAPLAWVFAVPMLWACQATPGRWRALHWCIFGATAQWVLLLLWLRHVYAPYGWLAVLGLGGFLGALYGLWFWWAGRRLRKVATAKVTTRLKTSLALAGAWVALEWVRSWLLTGFPWLPLAASHWQQPALLQLAPWTGAYGVSFLLILANLAATLSLLKLLAARKTAQRPRPLDFARLLRPSAEWSLVLLLSLGAMGLFSLNLRRDSQREPLLSVALIQPWTPAELKWDAELASEHLRVLRDLTHEAALQSRADLVLWPEAATPLPILDGQGDSMKAWIEELATGLQTPILNGNLAYEPTDANAPRWANGLYLVRPDLGLVSPSYTKRQLVPFGEYTPLAEYLQWLGKVVPLPGQTRPGEQAVPIPLPLGENRSVTFGGLICYEDAFPKLGRESAREVDVLVVVTNDAWYGTGSGAYQHAAHSVLRAVENHRPLMRTGNHGWSGWVDEWGRTRATLTNQDGSIYTRGWLTVQLDHLPELARQPSFYQRFGDWFVLLCAAFGIIDLCSRFAGQKDPASHLPGN